MADMSTEQQGELERFEAWCRTVRKLNVDRIKGKPDAYKYMETRHAWFAWEEAARQARASRPSLVQPVAPDLMLACKLAMIEANRPGTTTDWTQMIAAIDAALEGTGEERKPHSVNQTSTSTKVPDAADEGAGSGHAGVVISAYAIDVSKLDTITVERTRQVIGPARWAVRLNGDCLNKSGQWEWEPMPSSRDADFMERCRFASAEEAIRAALAASGNGSVE